VGKKCHKLSVVTWP